MVKVGNSCCRSTGRLFNSNTDNITDFWIFNPDKPGVTSFYSKNSLLTGIKRKQDSYHTRFFQTF